MSTLTERIDHAKIDPDAVKIVRRLGRYGHEAYLVGGCVRDLLLGCTPKDFDVATSATPNEIRRLFRNSRIIGRRFRLVHIFFGPKIIETSTFRQNPRPDADADNGEAEDETLDSDALLIRQDNVFGTALDDALRRDFTCNGLFYDPVKRQVIDFVDGLPDLERRSIRTIGDPDIRFQEDPVRILRAIKFAARLGLDIEAETYRAMREHREKIRLCAKARVLEEIYRLLREGHAARVVELLEESEVLHELLPELTAVIADPTGRELLFARLTALDSMVAEEIITNPVLLGALYFDTLLPMDTLFGPGADGSAELGEVLQEVLSEWMPSRKDRDRTRQILMAQRRLHPNDAGRRRRRRPTALVTQDYFPEALTLYKLFCHTGEADPSTLEKWDSLQPASRQGDAQTAPRRGRRRPRHRGRRPRHRPKEGGQPS